MLSYMYIQTCLAHKIFGISGEKMSVIVRYHKFRGQDNGLHCSELDGRLNNP